MCFMVHGVLNGREEEATDKTKGGSGVGGRTWEYGKTREGMKVMEE